MSIESGYRPAGFTRAVPTKNASATLFHGGGSLEKKQLQFTLDNAELFQAIREKSPVAAKRAIDLGVDVNELDNQAETPLLKAIRSNQEDLVALLLGRGAKPSVNKRGLGGAFPLLSAAFNNNLQATTLLLDHGGLVSLNWDNHYGTTPLLAATKNNNQKMVSLLLLSGATDSLNYANQDRETPLYWAVKNKNIELIRGLLAVGAQPTRKLASLDKPTKEWLAEQASTELDHVASRLAGHNNDMSRAEQISHLNLARRLLRIPERLGYQPKNTPFKLKTVEKIAMAAQDVGYFDMAVDLMRSGYSSSIGRFIMGFIKQASFLPSWN